MEEDFAALGSTGGGAVTAGAVGAILGAGAAGAIPPDGLGFEMPDGTNVFALEPVTGDGETMPPAPGVEGVDVADCEG